MIEIGLNKVNKKNTNIDIHIGGDLLNQIIASTFAFSNSFKYSSK